MYGMCTWLGIRPRGSVVVCHLQHGVDLGVTGRAEEYFGAFPNQPIWILEKEFLLQFELGSRDPTNFLGRSSVELGGAAQDRASSDNRCHATGRDPRAHSGNQHRQAEGGTRAGPNPFAKAEALRQSAQVRIDVLRRAGGMDR